MRILFAGTPDFAAAHLRALASHAHELGIELVGVYTQPDRPAGRGKKLQPSAVKSLALELGLPVEQPASLKSPAAQATLADYQADLMVVVAYGLLLPQSVLDTPTFGCINVHGSLLPRWRGAAPIQRAIWAGDAQTGVAIMQMEAGLDTGPVLLEKAIPIAADDTSASLYEKLAELGPKSLLEALQNFPTLRANATVQRDELSTYARKLSKAEAEIDWQQSAVAIERQIRAFNPWPVSWFTLAEQPDLTIKVWAAEVEPATSGKAPGTIVAANKTAIEVQTGDGILRLKAIQLPGKKALPVDAVLNARSDWFEVGTMLPSPTAQSDL